MKNFASAFILVAILTLSACSKKTIPEKDSGNANTETKPPTVVKPAIKTPTPKSIVVNEAAAKTATNGRRYYDLEGKRYWRNKNDGKFYLYYKGMFEKPEFQ